MAWFSMAQTRAAITIRTDKPDDAAKMLPANGAIIAVSGDDCSAEAALHLQSESKMCQHGGNGKNERRKQK